MNVREDVRSAALAAEEKRKEEKKARSSRSLRSGLESTAQRITLWGGKVCADPQFLLPAPVIPAKGERGGKNGVLAAIAQQAEHERACSCTRRCRASHPS